MPGGTSNICWSPAGPTLLVFPEDFAHSGQVLAVKGTPPMGSKGVLVTWFIYLAHGFYFAFPSQQNTQGIIFTCEDGKETQAKLSSSTTNTICEMTSPIHFFSLTWKCRGPSACRAGSLPLSYSPSLEGPVLWACKAC